MGTPPLMTMLAVADGKPAATPARPTGGRGTCLPRTTPTPASCWALLAERSRSLDRPRALDGDRGLLGSRDQHEMSSAVDSGAASVQLVSLVLAQPAPHPVALAGLQRPGQACLGHRTAVADRFGFGEVVPRRLGGSGGEEQLGMLGAASRLVQPIHLTHSTPLRATADGIHPRSMKVLLAPGCGTGELTGDLSWGTR